MPDGTQISRVDQLIGLARDLQPHSDDAAARELIAAAATFLRADPMKQICETYALASYLEVCPAEAGDDDHEREMFFDDAASKIAEAGEELSNHFVGISENYAGY